MRRPGLVLTAALAGLALIAAYLLLGGRDYAPAAVANPCKERPVQHVSGTSAVTEQLALSALDGAACQLGVSREELVLSMRSQHDLSVFLRSHHVGTGRLTQALRAGALRAVDQAERQGWLSGLQALAVREIVANVPIDALIRAIRSRSLLG